MIYTIAIQTKKNLRLKEIKKIGKETVQICFPELYCLWQQ